MGTAEAAAKGALGGLLVAFAWMHRGTIGMLFGGALIGALLTGWYWNDSANAAQMRKAIDSAYSMVPISYGTDSEGGYNRVRVSNTSAYDMDDMTLTCGDMRTREHKGTLKSNSSEDINFYIADVNQVGSLPCKIEYTPVDRRKLGENAHDIQSAGTF